MPLDVISMVTAVANAVVEICKVYQTPSGQKLIEGMISDRAKWDAFWKNLWPVK